MTQRNSQILGGFAAFTTVALLSTTTLAGTKVGVVGALNPVAKARSEAGEERSLKVGDDIFLNDTIITTGKGSAQLMFLDKSALTISPNSSVTVDTFVYNPNSGDGSMSLNSAKGAFRFIGGALTKKKPVKIKTPVSTIGIRGGIVDGHITPNSAEAIFLFGKEMTTTDNQGNTQSTNTFGTGFGIGADGRIAPLPPGVINQRIQNSPAAAAANNAPSSGGGQGGGEVNQKLNIHSTSKSQGGSNSGNGNTTGGGNNSGGNTGGNTGGGSSSNNSGGTSGNNNGGTNTSGGDNTGGPFDNTNTAGDNTGGTGDNNDGGTQFASFDDPNSGSGLKDDNPILPGGDGGGEIGFTTAALEGGNSSQEDLRDNVNRFVETGGDGDGDGRLDFNVADTNLQNPDDPNGPLIIDPNLRNPDDPNNPPPPGGDDPNGPPPGDDPNGPPPGDDPNGPPPGDDTTGGGTPPGGGATPPGGGGGGGGGGANSVPIAPSDTLAGGAEYTVMPNGYSSRLFTVAELLAGASDPDGDPVNVIPGSHSVVSGNATFTYDASTGGGFFKVDDVAPGDVETVTVSYQVTDGVGGITTRTMDIIINGQDFFGGSVAWDSSPPASFPTLPGTAEKQGMFAVRDQQGTVANTNDDEIEVGFIEAFDGTGSGNTRYESKNVFAGETKERFAGAGGGLPYTANVSENFVIGALPLAGTGFTTTASNSSWVETEDGRVEMDTSFNGYSFGNSSGSLEFYHAKWVDDNDTATPTDDNTEFFRAYFLTSDLYNVTDLANSSLIATPDTFTDVFDARFILQDMQSDSYTTAAASNAAGVIEYNFLPNLVPSLGGSSIERFGVIDYNHQPGTPGAPVLSNHQGVFVSWNPSTPKFLGGFVDFVGGYKGYSDPAIRVLYGDVKDPTSSITAYDDSTGAITGQTMDGVYYGLDQGQGFGDSGRTSAPIHVESQDVGNDVGGASSTIDSFVFSGLVDGTNERIKQAVTADTGATSGVFPAAVGSRGYTGFTAGLAVDTGENVARIKNADPNDVNVTVASDGGVGGAIQYYVVEDSGTFDDADAPTVLNIGSVGGGDHAALQDDMYAAELTGTKSTTGVPSASTKGTIVSMHSALTNRATDLVCNSCQFSHWGVWQADHINGTPLQKSAIVPYVVGEITPYSPGTGSGDWDEPGIGPGTLGLVTYNGEAAANIAITPDGAATEFYNEIGSMTAQINLSTRAIPASQLNINFNNIGGDADRALHVRNNGVINFDGSVNKFTGQVQNVFTDANDVETNSGTPTYDPTGSVNGALFGPNAEEVGGNFNTTASTGAGGETIETGGIFQGKRP